MTLPTVMPIAGPVASRRQPSAEYPVRAECRFDIRQPLPSGRRTPLPKQQTRRPSQRGQEQSCRRRSALPGKRASRADPGVAQPPGLLAAQPRSPWAPAAPPPPQLSGADRQGGLRAPARRRPPPLPAAGQRPAAPGRRAAPRPHLVDVAGGAADALNQLEVLLRVPAGTDRSRGFMAAPGSLATLPPGQGRASGATRRGAGWPPLRRSQLPGSTLRPPPRTTTAGLTVPAPAAPPRRRTRSHPRSGRTPAFPSSG